MAYIEECTTWGLAGRDGPYRVRLNRDINIFFGSNGSGKTSLLKILHSAMRGNSQILRNVPFTRAEVKIYSNHAKQVFTRSIVQAENNRSIVSDVETGTDESLQGSYYVELDDIDLGTVESRGTTEISWATKPKLPSDMKGRWAQRYLPTSRLLLGVGSASRRVSLRNAVLSEEQLDLYFAQSLISLWRGYSAGILRAVRQAQEDGLANILKAVLTTAVEEQIMEEVDTGL